MSDVCGLAAASFFFWRGPNRLTWPGIRNILGEMVR